MNYDLIIIGSGPGGYVAAIRGAQLGMKVALVEKYNTLGGTCLNVGCIPSKAWLDSSERFFNAKHDFKTHGIETGGLKLNLEQMRSRVQDVVSKTCDGVKYLMKKNKIDVHHGVGSFVSEYEIKVQGKKEVTITGKNIIIATGSKPSSLPMAQIDKERVITSTEALQLSKVPKHLMIIGGGVIGLELGSVFTRLGAKVSVVEYADRIIPGMDKDLSKELMKVLKKEGMSFYLNHGVTDVKRTGNDVELKATDHKKDKELNLVGDYCLVAVGRRPYTEGLGLEKIGIKRNERGQVITNDSLQTNISHIYAIGDVTTGTMLAHKAEEEGVFVVESLTGQKPHIDHNLIPGVVYTWPEVAAVGKTEEALKAENVPYKKGSFPFMASGRARASHESAGFIKVLAHKETDEILGVHMIGPRCADLISEAVVAMEFRASAEDIARICHAHPTYSESFKEAALAATENRALHI